MRIALDYDKTYTLDPPFWDNVMRLAEHCGHEVFCVTMRKPTPEEQMTFAVPSTTPAGRPRSPMLPSTT